MPTYVYACRDCDDRLEVVQKMSDDPLRDCPRCSGSLRRVLFAPAVVYKGSGFYTTDYKNGGRKAEKASPESGEGGTAAAAPEPAAASKSEPASAAKAEAGTPA